MNFNKRIGQIERRRRIFPGLTDMTPGQFQDWLEGATDKELDRAYRVTTAALRSCQPGEVESLNDLTSDELAALIAEAEAELKQGEKSA